MKHAWEMDLSRLPGPLGKLGKKEIHLWAAAWLRDRVASAAVRSPIEHVLFAYCDHYEPLHGDASLARGRERVMRWRTCYESHARPFRDSNGRAPRHSFFFPGEQYDPSLVEPIAELVSAGHGEVEVHLHHDGDTRATLAASLQQTLHDLGEHGVVAKDATGKPAWSFIHGNWCLANARRDGRWCGVDDELDLLFELGCYADFTFPSAPDQCQPGVVNRIYYPAGDVRRRRAYEYADIAHVGARAQEKVLLIEGPIALARRPGSISPRIESSAIDASDPPTTRRVKTWLEQRIHVRGRPEWVFVKIHTHGAPEKNADIILGAQGAEMHAALGQVMGRGVGLHYVSAREMFNVARAAIDGRSGDPSAYFDYVVAPPERARS